MSLICPACSASYNIPAAVLGPQGRKVSCAKCGHQWHAMPPKSEDPAPIIPELDMAKFEFAPQLETKPAPKPEMDPAEERRERIKAAQLTPIKLPEPEAHWLIFFRQFFPFASLALLALLVGAIIMFRVPITQKLPGMLTVYDFIGISALPPGGGISIVNVRDESRFGAVDNALVLTGQLVNHTPKTLTVPMFKLEFTSPQGQTKTFMARSQVEKIDGGQMTPFTLERAGFAQLGWQVKVTFGDGTEGEDTGKPMQTKVETKQEH